MTNKKPLSFGKTLKKLRKEKGLNWYQMQKKSGIQRQVIRAIEDEKNHPTITTALKLLVALDCKTQVEYIDSDGEVAKITIK